jgi:hypothetical protein
MAGSSARREVRAGAEELRKLRIDKAAGSGVPDRRSDFARRLTAARPAPLKAVIPGFGRGRELHFLVFRRSAQYAFILWLTAFLWAADIVRRFLRCAAGRPAGMVTVGAADALGLRLGVTGAISGKAARMAATSASIWARRASAPRRANCRNCSSVSSGKGTSYS